MEMFYTILNRFLSNQLCYIYILNFFGNYFDTFYWICCYYYANMCVSLIVCILTDSQPSVCPKRRRKMNKSQNAPNKWIRIQMVSVCARFYRVYCQIQAQYIAHIHNVLDGLLTFLHRYTRQLLLFRFLMKPNETEPHKKKCAPHVEQKWKSTFRACEINSPFQFGSMEILNFYALRVTYVMLK